MYRIAAMLLVALLGIQSTIVQAEARQITLRGAYVVFPPLTYTDRDGEPAGVILDLIDALVAELGYQISWQEMPVRRIHQQLQAGQIDIWPTTAGIPAIQSAVYETPFPASPIRLSAFHLPGTAAISRPADLVGSNLVLLHGYTYLGVLDDILDNPGTVVSYSADHDAALQMLLSGRGDYLIDFDIPLEHALLSHPVETLSSSVLAEFPLTYAFSRKLDSVETLISQLSRAYETYTAGAAAQ